MDLTILTDQVPASIWINLRYCLMAAYHMALPIILLMAVFKEGRE